MADFSNNGSMQSVTGSKNALYVESIKFEKGNGWQRRSSTEKKLIVLLVIVFLIALILFIVLLVLATRTSADPSKDKIQQTTPPGPKQPGTTMTTTDPSNDTTQPTTQPGPEQPGTTMTNTDPSNDTTQPTTQPGPEQPGTTMTTTDPSNDTTQPTTPQGPEQPDICITPGCVEAAARILDRADFTADPCEDFYQYSCGSWMKKNIIAEDRSGNDIFYLLTDKLNIQLKALIEAPYEEDASDSIKEAKELYQSCLDLATLDDRGGKPLLDSLPEFGGWPVLSSDWNESSFSLETMLGKLSRHNQVPVIYMAVLGDIGNTTVNKVYFDQPSLGMSSRDYYLRGRNDTTLMAYQNYITKIAVALGADPADAETQIEEMVDFEIELANISVPLTERYDQSKLYNLMSIEEMAQNYSAFDWLGYLKSVIAIEGVGINITADEVIVNWSPSYFEKLFPLLESTPKRVQANYLVWILIQQRVKLLDTNFRDILKEYNKVLTGVATEPPRWRVCLTYVNTAMPLAVARLFTDAHFDEKAKSTMEELISYLRTSFNELLEEADWMDDATREVAREKAAVMKEKIGYPDRIKNNTFLEERYKLHNFSVGHYYENVVLEHKIASKNNLKLLRQSVDRSKWLVQPAVVNAFYYPSWNEIVFPAGILQIPFYSEHQPWSINFGGIGSVIGHEITHGFDNSGRQRDKDGNLRQWWDDFVIEKFNNETQCFKDQTSEFFMPEAEMNVNGELTIGEDVADAGGMKQSYRAYRTFITKQGKEEPLLPGVKLNNNQLFFLSWGQIWCTKIRPATAVRNIFIDYHSPNRLRAIAPMKNTPEFAEAFQCKKDSPMNPTKKCSVW